MFSTMTGVGRQQATFLKAIVAHFYRQSGEFSERENLVQMILIGHLSEEE